MKKIAFYVAFTAMLSGLNVAYANHHESDDANHGAKCEDMSKADFGISGLDTNKDNVITVQEYLAGGSRNTEKTFKHMDANNDGVLDMAEQKEIEAVYKKIHEKPKATM